MFIRGKQDSTLNAEMAALIDLSQDTVILEMSKLDMYYNKFHINNSDLIRVTYDPSDNNRTFNFSKFTLASSIINVDLSGKISLNSESDFTAEMSNIDIPSILQYAYNPKSVYAVKESQKFKTPISGKIRRISLYFKGFREDPKLQSGNEYRSHQV